MKNYPTPHIDAKPSDFGKTVLMPGDPLRAKLIADTFLTDAVLVNNVRGVQGYTGNYDGVKVSVMASGMGCPSMGIYSYELFNYFGVENIIRIGSAGAIQTNINVRDIVLAQAACTDSAYVKQFGFSGQLAPIASYKLLTTAERIAKARGLCTRVGNVFSSDCFYSENKNNVKTLSDLSVLAVEMEAAALYVNAMKSGKNALAICTVSDNILTGESLSAIDRQNTFTDMMELALCTAAETENNHE